MSSIRRNIMIDGLFYDIASKEDIETVNRLYREGNKGSAIALQLRRIKDVWVKLLNHKYESQQIGRGGLFEANF